MVVIILNILKTFFQFFFSDSFVVVKKSNVSLSFIPSKMICLSSLVANVNLSLFLEFCSFTVKCLRVDFYLFMLPVIYCASWLSRLALEIILQYASHIPAYPFSLFSPSESPIRHKLDIHNLLPIYILPSCSYCLPP